MPKYIERYKDTKRPIKFKDKVEIIDGIHKGKIGVVGAKDPSGLPAYNVWFEDGTFDCFMYDEFVNADENVADLQIIQEVHQYDHNDVLVRYKDKKKNCIVKQWYKFYQTPIGRYIKIKGKRYYVDDRYRYRACEKGDDFDFSNFRVIYYDYDSSWLVLIPLKELKVKDFKNVLEKNGLLNGHETEEWWNYSVDEIYYTDYGCVNICICYCDILGEIRLTKKDSKIFELLKEVYFSDQDGD